MGQMEAPPQRSRLRFKGTIEQRIAHTAMEASCAVMRGEQYSEHLVGRAHELFSADAGVGLTTWCPSRLDATDQLAVAVAGISPLSIEQTRWLAPSPARIQDSWRWRARAQQAPYVSATTPTW